MWNAAAHSATDDTYERMFLRLWLISGSNSRLVIRYQHFAQARVLPRRQSGAANIEGPSTASSSSAEAKDVFCHCLCCLLSQVDSPNLRVERIGSKLQSID
jgi:hypothetical protein